MFNRSKKKKTLNYPTMGDFMKLQKRVENNHIYLNNLFVYNKLENTAYINLLRSISYELLKFFDNVCIKYDINYWLDFGTLLGAVRHQDFIPWDDDLDVGMLRADYYKFLEEFPKEFKKANFTYVETWFKDPSWAPGTIRWYQINCKNPDFKGKFVGIDVFPYDFINEFDDDYIDRFKQVVRPKFFKSWNGEIETLKKSIDESCESLNLSLDETDYYIGGVDCCRALSTYSFKFLKTKDLFPLKRMQFGKYNFLAPNNIDVYLKGLYGSDYMKIGKSMKDHGRLNRYKKLHDILKILSDVERELIEVNENFE